jgi:YidC/Oxa1 family membrane protein insertase
MQQKNLVLFIVLSLLILLGSLQLQNWLNPKPKQKAQPAPKADADAGKPKPEQAKRIHAPPPARPIDPGIQLGDDSSKLKVVLDPWGAGVRSLTDNEFKQADELGKPDVDKDGKPKKLELIEAKQNLLTPSYVLYHYPLDDKKADRPLDTLGRKNWRVVKPDPVVPGQSYERVVFETEVRDVRITKTFTLGKDDYHVGLEVKIELVKEYKGKRTEKFRYQIAGSHGVRMEGIWYASRHRDAMILRVDRKRNERVERPIEELRRLSLRGGGDEVRVSQDGEWFIRWGLVATQYFASGVVVSDEQMPDIGQHFIAQARPTIEAAWLRGKIHSIADDKRSFELDVTGEGGLFSGPPKKEIHTIVLGPNVELPEGVGVGSTVAVNYTLDGYNDCDQMRANEILPPSESNQLRTYFDDITVRLSTHEIPLELDKRVVHEYLLYNGPAKVRLLADSEGVSQSLVTRYEETLRLDKITDYHSNSWFGEVAETIHWTQILVWFTNRMHDILWGIHRYLFGLPFGLCIILLTLLVRSAMFPLSRKQTMAAQRMQEKMAKLKPEIEKLKEKYKGDPQALKQAQTELMLKNGLMNPFGSCWIMLLQMPIFMGLYFCLQESIHFRLAPFAWIENLAAPDMLLYWSQSIPLISSPANYSGSWTSILYLGPFFNLLPIIAVAFMIVQQSMLMPPPTDEQAATQQKMMKYMTVFFGLMFYKVAAGLCIYFIVSSVWGFCERKLLPKKQAGGPDRPEKPRGRFAQWMLDRMQAARDGAASPGAASPPVRNGSPQTPSVPRDKRAPKKPQRKPAPVANSNGMLHKLRTWWQQVLKEARKK